MVVLRCSLAGVDAARTTPTNAHGPAAVVTGMALVGDSWWVLELVPVLAVLCARTACIGHDAGHARISGNRVTNRRIGLIHGNLLLGMNYAWWNDKHNRVARPSAVKAHGRGLGIPHAETGLVDTYRQGLRHMHKVGEPLRADI
ncbi:fatty acid desaturase [Streptomyces sp. UH6]|nr:fatty acid desaturase [Streptomyces sp. UH6]